MFEENKSFSLTSRDSGLEIVSRSNKPDIVGEKYLVRSDLPLPQYDNHFCKAFRVDNLKKPEEKVYGMVYNSAYYMKLREINSLKNLEIESMYLPLAADVTFLTSMNSNEFVIILPEPTGVSLNSYVKNNHPLTSRFIIDQVVFPLVKMLYILGENGISHGSINPDNVYICDDGSIKVAECVTETTGFSQLAVYEPIERLAVTPHAKTSFNSASDYYSLGVLISFMVIGKEFPLLDASEDEILKEKILKGSYEALLSKHNIPLALKELIKGLICDKKTERWRGKQILDWYNGKVYKPSIFDNTTSSQSIQFNNESYYSTKILAHDLFCHWDAAKRFLMDDKIVKWLEKGLSELDVAEHVSFSLRMAHSQARAKNQISDEGVTRVLAALDPLAPVKYKDICTHLGGIGSLIAASCAESNIDFTRQIGQLVSSCPWKEVSKEHIYYWSADIKRISDALEKSKMFIERPGLGFGIERALYTINTNLPCQSKFIKHYYVTDVHSLLLFLDKEAADEDSADVEIIDTHIAAFIAEKMNIQDEIKVNSLKPYPDFFQDSSIKALAFLSIAQKNTKPGRLVNLANLCAIKVSKVLSKLNNRGIREDVKRQLLDVARDGMLVEIYKIISNAGYIQTDAEGFEKASKLYAKLQIQKTSLSNNKKILELGYRYGLRLSVIVAYVLCSIMFIYLFARYL